MKIKGFDGIEVKVEDGVVSLSQTPNGSYYPKEITFPVEFWEAICGMIEDAIFDGKEIKAGGDD